MFYCILSIPRGGNVSACIFDISYCEVTANKYFKVWLEVGCFAHFDGQAMFICSVCIFQQEFAMTLKILNARLDFIGSN